MDNYKVKIYPSAKRDLLDVIRYLNQLSPKAALDYYDKLTEEIAGLSQMPLRCPVARDEALAARGYRYLLVGSYVVLYVVVGETVQIRRILYARSNYAALL